MGTLLTAIIIAAAAAALIYSQLGKRVGYGNSNSVWTLTGATFAMVFIVALIVINLF